MELSSNIEVYVENTSHSSYIKLDLLETYNTITRILTNPSQFTVESSTIYLDNLWVMCYKSGERCKYDCNGLCKDSN